MGLLVAKNTYGYVYAVVSNDLLNQIPLLYARPWDSARLTNTYGLTNDRFDKWQPILYPYLKNITVQCLRTSAIIATSISESSGVFYSALLKIMGGIEFIDVGEYTAKITDATIPISWNNGNSGVIRYSIDNGNNSPLFVVSYSNLPYYSDGSILFLPQPGFATVGTSGRKYCDDIEFTIYVCNSDFTQYNAIEFHIQTDGLYVSALNKKNIALSNIESIWLYNSVEPITNFDPYAGGGASGSGGGTGSFDGTGDAISAPSVPTLGATNTGFVSLYNPTLSQVQELASYMWSDAFSIDSFKKLFADPMDTILGLSIVPVAVPDGETTTLKVGNLSTGISITRAGAQYITVDCGSIAVNEYWGAYLDYAPYTKLEIYLPYIGTHQLSADDVMGKTISVKYNVDILSGSCVAFITCGDSVLYTFSGQCSQNIPITGEDFASNLMGAISFAASAGAVVASGGGAATVMPAAAGLTSSYINAFKPDIQRSGNIGGTSGMLGIQVPYLILTRPRQCTPENQNKYLGYPSFITEELSDLSGYTEIEDIQLEGCTATDTEIDEIKSLLAGGVLL